MGAEVSRGSGASDEMQGWAHLLSLEVGFFQKSKDVNFERSWADFWSF